MELKILESPLEYVQKEQSPTVTTIVNDSDYDFQDPPSPINNRGKEKVDTCSSPPKKKSRHTISHIQNKSPPRVISKQRDLTKSPRNVNIEKRTKAPHPKKQTKKSAKVPAITGIKKNVEIKENDGVEVPRKVPTVGIFVRVNITSSSPEVTFQQPPARSPVGQSDFSPLVQ
uniref:Uncharacterized protein n=1 Tax=Solanum lycopersicum TaxID=4081 RepID=A0A3Q7FMA0_SOLLC